MIRIITELEARFIEQTLEDAYEEIDQLDEGNTTGVLESIKEATKILGALEKTTIEDLLNDE